MERKTFRDAHARAIAGAYGRGSAVHCAGEEFQLIQLLGRGTDTEIHFARRSGAFPYFATLKLAMTEDASDRLAREAASLSAITSSLVGAASLHAWNSLPQMILRGPVRGSARQALVFRHAFGFWGDLAQLQNHFPSGIDPRHSVWIWRRLLNSLHFIHSLGWAHGDIRPEHALIHPGDHAIQIIGWSAATRDGGEKARVQDLKRSARILLALGGSPSSFPDALSGLLDRAAHDDDFCKTHGAQGLDTLLQSAARSVFGPPSFVHLRL